MSKKKAVLGIQVAPSTLESVKRQVRRRAVEEDRTITLSDLIREALVAYGIDLGEPGNPQLEEARQ